MTEISFPNPGDPGYPDGISCETYAFGWQSGCTDENGDYRGFTQEWYFDEAIGAWVSVTTDATGGADINGYTYDDQVHASPQFVAGITGNIRKLAFLDPDTGSLTFDYIREYDVVSKAESQFTASGSWDSRSDNEFDRSNLTADPKHGVNGLTLCGPKTHTHVWYSASNTNTAFEIIFNGATPSPFAPAAPEYIVLNYDPSMYGTGVTSYPTDTSIQIGAGGIDFATGSGSNEITVDEVYIAFTGDGPMKNIAKMRYSYVNPTTGTTANVPFNQAVSTENYYYVWTSPTGDIGWWNSTRINTEIKNAGATGLYGMINPSSSGTSGGYQPINHNLGTLNFSASDFGLATGQSNSGYLYVAFPERVNMNTTHLYYTPSAPAGQASGFDPSDTTTVSIQNDHGYSESYDLFRSASSSGVDTNNQSGQVAFKIIKTS